MRRSIVPAIIATLVAALAPALAAGAAPASPAGPGSAVAVRLITGDTVTLEPGTGRPKVAIALRTHHGVAGEVSTFAKGKDLYVFPGAARRFLGSVLDPSLFDVTKLARHGSRTRVPVIVTFAPRAKPRVPGLTVTSRTATSESGYLTPAGTRVFGAALARNWRADARAGRVPRTLFGVTHIASPGATPVAPRFQQYTLVMHVINPAGKPADFAFISLTNVDDGAKFTNFLVAIHGLAKVSVPAGNYSGLAEYDRFRPRGVGSYLVPVEQVSVTHNNTVMTFDTRKATTVPSVATPRPAGLEGETLEWDRDTPHSLVAYSTTFGVGSRVHVAPSAPATEGKLHWVTTWQLAQTPASGTPYSYDLAFDDEGQVPADQSHTLSPGDLAQVNSRYYTDQQARTAFYARGAFFRFQFFSFLELLPLQTPTARTEYVNAPAGARWSSILIAAASNSDPGQGAVFDGDRAYTPGSVLDADWLRGPLGPGMQEPTPGSAFFCGYCRGPRSMALLFNPFIDTTKGHAGTFDVPRRKIVAARFSLYRDGSLVRTERNSTGDFFRVPSGNATYRAIVRTDRGVVGFATSTRAVEDVTFRSSASSGPHVPRRWFCIGPHSTCTAVPLLTATAFLPTDLEGTMPRGASTVTFVVRHVAGADDPAISHVIFAVTGDQGRTYHRLPVTSLAGDHYQVTLHNPSAWANHGIGIRIRATDAAGGSLTDTVSDAYFVSQT